MRPPKSILGIILYGLIHFLEYLLSLLSKPKPTSPVREWPDKPLDDTKPYEEVPNQLSNTKLLADNRREKDPARRLFPAEAILSRGRIINPLQFIVAVKKEPGITPQQEEAIWKVGNQLSLVSKQSEIQVEIKKSRKCSPDGKRYVLLQAVNNESINQLEGRSVDIVNAQGNSVGKLHDGGGSNAGGGREHSGGQSNCFGAAMLVRPLPDRPSELSKPSQFSDYSKKIIVAVLDSGLLPYPHRGDGPITCSDPKQFGWNFVDDNANLTDNHEGLHGTKVSTLIKQYAPDTKILPVKVANEHGVLDLYDVLCGLEYARTHGATVVNASWSFSANQNNTEETDFPLLLGAIRDLDESGVVVVAAAGNRSQYVPEAKGEIARNNAPRIYPACYSAIQGNVITVTTVIQKDDKFMAFENYSPRYVDTGVVPPTASPALPEGEFAIDGFRGSYEGSSFATPIVAARVASLLSSLMGFTSKRRILHQLKGFHEKDDLINEIRDGGCYMAE
ncbi:S8 family peptidase [Spirosoma aerophilum]